MNLLLCQLFVTLLLVAGKKQKYQFECPGDGIFADPENCQCFYDCANNIPYNQCCNEGTMFDDVYSDCDFTNNVDCGDRPYPDGSTSPHPPTTSTSSSSTSSTMTSSSTTSAYISSTVPPSTSSETPTSTSETTSNHPQPTGSYPGLPNKVLGMYILLADDTEEGFHSDADWEPKLFPYQQQGANVLFFTFINPETMAVPEAFKKLALSRGTEAEGSVPADTRIIFAIGGYAYSLNPNPWQWLTSQQLAEDMAVQVAQWRDLYNIDGIDLDIEAGAGDKKEAGPNLIHFIRKLKSIHPDLIVSQPTYGYPQVQAEIDVINASWNVGGTSNNLADSVGLMVYEGTQSLQYVKNYAHGSSQWEGFPIEVDVTSTDILLGCKGSANSADIMTLAQESVRQELLGVMVWFCSVQDGLVYGESWDCSGSEESSQAYIEAMQYLNSNS